MKEKVQDKIAQMDKTTLRARESAVYGQNWKR